MLKLVILLIALPLCCYGQEHARILDHSIQYTIYDNEKAEIDEYYKVIINSEKGEFYGIFQDYTDRFRKITEVTVDVYDQNGKRVKRLKRNDGQEFGFNPSYEINDSKVLVIRPEYKQYPYTVEITSKVKLNGFISFSTWVPRPYFNIAVNHSKLIVSRPTDFKIKFKEDNITGTTQVVDKNTITQYEISNLPHTNKRLRYEDFYEEQPKVYVSPEKFRLDNSIGSSASWKDFGNWFLSLNHDPYELTQKTKDFIDSIKLLDKRVIIERTYEYMQNRTRYISIQLGIGGFKSLPTEEVEKFGYGDCKALTTYMKNMLEYANVKSNYILAKAGKDVPDVLKDFPSNQFNHVFLGIPTSKDTIFLECTSQILPPNYIGSFTDDRNVLWIEDNNSSIVRSRIYNQLANIQNNNSKIALEDNGNASIDLETINEGALYDEIMLYKLSPTDYVKDHNQNKFNYKDFTIKKFSFDQPVKNLPAFKIKYHLQINNLANLVGTKLILPMVPTTPFQKYIDKDDLMRFYSIKRGLTIVDEISIQLPQNYWIYKLPELSEINSDFGSYKLSYNFDGSQLKINRKLILLKGDYTKDSYEQFKVFYQKIEKIEGRKLILNSKT